MPTVSLDNEDWQKVMAILAQAPWNVANPLLMKIGEQLRLAQTAPDAGFNSVDQKPVEH
jgi:hypothetical protein